MRERAMDLCSCEVCSETTGVRVGIGRIDHRYWAVKYDKKSNSESQNEDKH